MSPTHDVVDYAGDLITVYYSELPTKLDRQHMSKKAWVKARTQELYDMLPMTTLEERSRQTNIRDEIIELNEGFFGYVARNTYVTDPMVTDEDKQQSAILNFCEMWAKYKFTPKYRDDLSFAVFFKPRLSECIKREFNIIKYSTRRGICKKAADQLGKPWGELTKDDIQYVQLPPQEMHVLQVIFNTSNDATYEDSGVARVSASRQSDFVITGGLDALYTEQYDALEDLIVHEMIETSSKLDDAYLLKMATMYNIPFAQLKIARPIGEAKLKKHLEEVMDIQESFETADSYGNDSEDPMNFI